MAASAALVIIPGVPLGLLTEGVQTLAGVLLPSAVVFMPAVLLLGHSPAHDLGGTAIYDYIPHHRTKAKLEGNLDKPVTVAGQLPTGNGAARFNAWFAVKVTNGVGTMWCAYAFASSPSSACPKPLVHTTPWPWCPGYPRPLHTSILQP